MCLHFQTFIIIDENPLVWLCNPTSCSSLKYSNFAEIIWFGQGFDFKHHFKHLKFFKNPNAQIGKAFWKYLKCFPFILTIFPFVKMNFLAFNLTLYLVWFCHENDIFKKSIYSLEVVMSPIKLRTLQHFPIFNPFINTIGVWIWTLKSSCSLVGVSFQHLW